VGNPIVFVLAHTIFTTFCLSPSSASCENNNSPSNPLAAQRLNGLRCCGINCVSAQVIVNALTTCCVVAAGCCAGWLDHQFHYDYIYNTKRVLIWRSSRAIGRRGIAAHDLCKRDFHFIFDVPHRDNTTARGDARSGRRDSETNFFSTSELKLWLIKSWRDCCFKEISPPSEREEIKTFPKEFTLCSMPGF
jgi:hypothetical protein